ncbi:MAG: hypothetical protein RLZZ496_432 [Pseudomonadota bacterium]|jgi:exopolyphosphatase/guanosine-5'-triphosphate,3'-diphosphate pyrophosphatase
MSRAGVHRADESRGGTGQHHAAGSDAPRSAVYAALDLGTNNCRLLMARPSRDGFRVVDAFSRIVRLGEGVSSSRRLSDDAINRTIEALKICSNKMIHRGVRRARLIATEACRAAENRQDFMSRVESETGLRLEIIDRETEAALAAAGCAALADPKADSVVLFDIGGGSTEVVWLDAAIEGRRSIRKRIRSWLSLPVGVVNLSERHGGRDVTVQSYQGMVDEVQSHLVSFAASLPKTGEPRDFHLLGTSGTVTTLAGVHLGLPRYDRRAVDGIWMSSDQVSVIVSRLLSMDYAERVASACIGVERADLVLSGCAILDAIRKVFPSDRVRVADRGLREGILMQLMVEDGVWHDQALGAA